MFNWLKKRKPPSTLYFKSSDAAFDYATHFMQAPLEVGAVLIGQVIGKPLSDHATKQNIRVRLATERGVIETDYCGSIAADLASNLNLKTSAVQPGDLVAVEVGSYSAKYQPESHMQYFLVIAKLKPEIESNRNSFVPDITGDR